MNFNSIEYAIFLPIVFAIYWALPHKFRWVILLISSYYFYMSWNPKYVVLILFTTGISYTAGLLLEKTKKESFRKLLVAGTLVLCLGILFFFKYFNFMSESVTSVLGSFGIPLSPVTLKLLLPVGISFYTFQTLSYVIDVYRGEVKAETHFGKYATFISFFPQLVAGPIERTSNLLTQIHSEKHFDYDQAIYGARQILWGLFKKVVVADIISGYVDKVYENLPGCTSLDLCIAVFFFTIQIYCDFSGYSDMAIGSARLLGINLMKNFSSPYFSHSIKEFWSRWHISLSTWFRDYLYIPLGGNRCSKIRNSFNLLITFLVSGLWHGANWTYVIWGGIHGLMQVIEKSVKNPGFNKKIKIPGFVSWLFVFAFCNIAWIFFRAESFQDAVFVIKQIIIGFSDIKAFYLGSGISFDKIALVVSSIAIIIVGVFDFFSLKTDVIDYLKDKKVLRILLEYMLVIFIIYALNINTGNNQFVYFQF